MATETRWCARCKTDKPLDAFGSHRWCRDCKNAYERERHQTKVFVPVDATFEQIWNDYSEDGPDDGVGGKCRVLRKVTPKRRKQIASIERWCGNGRCIEPAHLVSGSAPLPYAYAQDVMVVDEGEVVSNGFTMTEERYSSPALAIRALEAWPHERLDKQADQFLAEHGFDRHGNPFTNSTKARHA